MFKVQSSSSLRVSWWISEETASETLFNTKNIRSDYSLKCHRGIQFYNIKDDKPNESIKKAFIDILIVQNESTQKIPKLRHPFPPRQNF